MDKTTMLECLINQYTDGNKAAFAKMLGINPQLISHWLRRNTFDNELLFAKSRAFLLLGYLLARAKCSKHRRPRR